MFRKNTMYCYATTFLALFLLHPRMGNANKLSLWHQLEMNSTNNLQSANHYALLSALGSTQLQQEFNIQSHLVLLQEGRRWCLEAKRFATNIQVIVSWCDDSQEQKWFLDANGFVRHALFPELCPDQVRKSNVLTECVTSSKSTMWIYSSDGTIRRNINTIQALSIRPNFLKPRKLARPNAKVSWATVVNRQPFDREKWRIFPRIEANPTTLPTMAPSLAPSVVTGVVEPRPLSNIFNIDLMNMGNITIFDDSFQKAKKKWEKMIIGDVLDHPSMPSSDFDWFGNTWPDSKINGPVDDVLIGYSFEYVDGEGGVIGFAGPMYVRNVKNDEGKSTSATTISAVMKFDIDDFSRLSPRDTALIITHEMGHALGIGSLWSNFRCGLNCPSGNTTYTCNKANKEYFHAMGGSRDLGIDSKSCSHWSELSFNSSTSSELMTPYFESGKYQPISRVSLAALEDLGYQVNMDAADPWLDISTSTRQLTAEGKNLDLLQANNTFSLEDNIVHVKSFEIDMKHLI